VNGEGVAVPRSIIQQFFKDYEEGANTFDPDLVTSQFAEVFIGGGPKGVFDGQNDERFREAIPKRKAFMEQIGFQAAKILSLDETVLDDHYTMVAVQWRMTFAKDGGTAQDAEFEILYFLFIQNEQPRIVMYISHDDEKETMREMGLLDS
jgi:hypothetical protein